MATTTTGSGVTTPGGGTTTGGGTTVPPSTCPTITATSTFKPALDHSIPSLSNILTVSNVAITPPSFYYAGQPLSISFNVNDTLSSLLIGSYTMGGVTPTIQIGTPIVHSNAVTAKTPTPVNIPITPATTQLKSGSPTQTFTATYVTTVGDVNNGSIIFNVSSIGNLIQLPLTTVAITAATVSATALYVPIVLLSTVTTSPSSFSVAGTKITFTYTITGSSSTVAFNDTSVTGSQAGLSGFDIGSVAVVKTGIEAYTLTSTYTTTLNDVTAGTNLTVAFLAGATTVNNITIAQNSTSPTLTTISFVPVPLVSIAISGVSPTAVSGGQSTVGSVVQPTYSAPGTLNIPIIVKNTGNVPLLFSTNSLTVNRTAGTTLVGSLPGSLAIGQTSVLSFNFTITQADVDAGSFTPTFTVTSNSYTAGTTNVTQNTTASISPKILAIQNPTLAVSEPTMPNFFSAGQSYSFIVQVANTGNTTINNITVTDTIGSTYVNTSQVTTLAPSATPLSFTGTYIVTSNDVTQGFLNQSVIADGTVRCS